jgi:uncharacterized membrane protein YbhN (UPF0104 family)
VRLKHLLHLVVVLAGLAVAALAARHFARTGWPIHHANPWLVALAALIVLVAYGLKAWGWQRLFRGDERPTMLTLAAAGGAASVGGIALPGRFDELIRVAVVRCFGRRRASVGAIGLSLFVLGLVDSAALAPLASIALAFLDMSWLMRAGLIVVAVSGVASAAVVLGLPRLVRMRLIARFRLAAWMSEHATSSRSAVAAWAAVAASWTLRGVAVFVLLAALGMGTDFALALAFVCAASASAVLPVAPAGAAMQAGAGAAILAATGVHTDQAIAFGVAAQGLIIGVGAIYLAAMTVAHAQARFRPAFSRSLRLRTG